MATQSEFCPWCGTVISRAKFDEIQAKIREQERKRLAEAEAALRKRFEIEKQDAEKRAKGDADKRIAAVAAERDRNIQLVKQLKAREAAIWKDAQEQAEAKAKKLRQEAERSSQRELARQREILEKDRDQALLKQQAEFNRRREAFQKKIKTMERELQQRSAHEVGDGAEIDLVEALREAFTEDRIKRIQKGQPGADILHEVLYKGEVCGRIIYDSKNRQVWQNVFAAKLRQDQVAAKADYAILATTVFPSGKKELCSEEGIIVASPARVIDMVEPLRGAMVKMHVLGVSQKERVGKTDRLYKYITSETHAAIR